MYKKLVRKFEEDTGGEVAVYLKDLRTGLEFGYNENELFTAASLPKVFIAGLAAEKELKKLVKIKKENRVGGAGMVTNLNQDEFSVNDLIEFSISLSDNTAANELIDTVGGIDEINKYLVANGFKKSKMAHKFMLFEGKGDNILTAKEIGLYLEKLTKGELKNSEAVLTAMSHQADQLRIPFLIKDRVLNKTGTLPHPDSVIHDAAIIKNGFGDLVMVILTKGVPDRKKTALFMQILAKNIYDEVIYKDRLKKILPEINELQIPLKDSYRKSYDYGNEYSYEGVNWGKHLGVDLDLPAGKSVYAAGQGIVVYSELHPGSKEKRNWGNIVIIAHKLKGEIIFSLYGHLGERLVKKWEELSSGKKIGTIGKENTPENGSWEEHLHFGIYKGDFKGNVLPGYEPPGKMGEWIKPQELIKEI